MDKTVVLLMKEFESEKKYWQDKLSGEVTEVKLIPDVSPGSGHQLKYHSFSFSDPLTQQIGYTSKNNDLSLYIILLAAFKVLLLRYTSQKDITVSSPMHAKDEIDYNEVIIIRDFIDEKMTFLDVLMAVKNTVTEAYKNQHYPLEKILEELDLTYYKNSFTKIILLLETIHKKENLQSIIESASNDITLSFVKTRYGIEGNISYNGKLFRESTIQRIFIRYQRVLEWVLSNMKVKLEEMELIIEEEKQKILHHFNNTDDQYPTGKTLHELFEMQGNRTPDKIALLGERRSERVLWLQHMTYRQLSEESNRLAHLLQTKGLRPNTIAAIMVRPSIETVIGILGILKIGAAYMPIEWNYPAERIKYMLADSSVNVLVTTNSLYEDRKIGRWEDENNLEIVLFDFSTLPSSHLHLSPAPITSLAYVIYTSGTTGKPKGVLIEHHGVVNYTYWRLKTYGLREKDVSLQLLSYAFDGFASNFYSSLFSGGTLIMIPGARVLDFDYIKEVVKVCGVTNTSLVPRIYELLIDSVEPGELKSLRFVVLAGEKPGEQLLQESQSKNPGLRHIMEYGPTETSVTATANIMINEANTPVIGRPISNVRVYITDPAYHLQPVGVAGELCITGVGLAKGYLNNPALTAQKFQIPGPQITQSLKTMPKTVAGKKIYSHMSYIYKTGDLARWLPDGNIEFFGRTDNQVKIRGFRIELEEVESHLSNHPGIREAAVLTLAGERGDHLLCAYLVTSVELTTAELREYLSKVLPNYMIPSHFVFLKKMPLTSRGKIDRKRMPEVVFRESQSFIAPRNNIEEKLVEIWSEVLFGKNTHRTAPGNYTPVGIDDNFFDLGGHSLKATVMLNRIHKELNVKLSLGQVFKAATIRELAELIIRSEEDKYVFIEPVEKKEYYPLSSSQTRMYIVQQMELTDVSYNIPRFDTHKGKLEMEKIKNAFLKLIKRHESLKTSFELVNSKPAQKIHEELEFSIEYHEVSSPFADVGKAEPGLEDGMLPISAIDSYLKSSVQKIMKEFVRSFDLTQPPLLRAGLIKLEEEKNILMLDMHHIICDGISVEILQKEFLDFYEGKKLPPLKLRYKDFSEWQYKMLESRGMKKQQDYWLKEFAGEIPVLNLPIDFPRPAVRSVEGNRVRFEIGKEETQKLKALASSRNTTIYIVMLVIYYILLAKLSGNNDIVVGTVVGGRGHADLEEIIGVFVNMLALRNFPGKNKTFEHFLREVKNRTIQAFDNQNYPFDNLVDKANVKRHPGRNPLFDVGFQLQEQERKGTGEEKPKPSTANSSPTFGYERNVAKTDMTFYGVYTTGDKLLFTVEYCTKLFKKETIRDFVYYFKTIVAEALKAPDIKIEEMEIIPGAKTHKIRSEIRKARDYVQAEFDI